MCGRQDHYNKVCPEIECHNCYQKRCISRECPLKESGYSSGYSSDGNRRHEPDTDDRDRSPLHSSRRKYEDNCSVNIGMVMFASHGNIFDSHFVSLFAEHLNSIEVTTYGRVV